MSNTPACVIVNVFKDWFLILCTCDVRTSCADVSLQLEVIWERFVAFVTRKVFALSVLVGHVVAVAGEGQAQTANVTNLWFVFLVES